MIDEEFEAFYIKVNDYLQNRHGAQLFGRAMSVVDQAGRDQAIKWLWDTLQKIESDQ